LSLSDLCFMAFLDIFMAAFRAESPPTSISTVLLLYIS
jgi:hypothetical protein